MRYHKGKWISPKTGKTVRMWVINYSTEPPFFALRLGDYNAGIDTEFKIFGYNVWFRTGPIDGGWSRVRFKVTKIK